MKNKLLSIVIPTYERAKFLDYCLETHIPLLSEYNIAIYIFDNNSTDNTEQIASKWMNEYSYLYYHKNETNIGPDANFERALKSPDSDYVWLLGDTYTLPEKGVSYLLHQIKQAKYDALVFNLHEKLTFPSFDYDDSNKLLNDFGGLMTCLSCLVFSKELLAKANFSRFYNSSFIQTGIIFESISNRNFNIHWVQEHSIESLEHPILKKLNWSHSPKAFKVGCEDWTNFVMSLPPSYKLDNKINCLLDFGKVSGLFTFHGLLSLRLLNLLNLDTLKKYKKLFPFIVTQPLVIYAIAFIPVIALKAGALLMRSLINLKKGFLSKKL